MHERIDSAVRRVLQTVGVPEVAERAIVAALPDVSVHGCVVGATASVRYATVVGRSPGYAAVRVTTSVARHDWR